MLGQLLFLVLTRLVAGTEVSGISFAVLDSNNTAAAPGEVPAALSIGFTATSTGTNLATINLPSGMLSDGNVNIFSSGRRLEEDDSDFGTAAQRRLAVVCEAYGTAVVSSNVLTVPVRKVGTANTACDTAGAAISMVLTAQSATFSSLGTGQLDFTVTFTTMPTVGFNVETWTHKFKTFTIWDLGLRSKARPLVRHYTPDTDMVIFMLHRSDALWEAEELLGYVCHGLEDVNKDVPFLFFLNFKDLPFHVDMLEACEALKLQDLAKRHRVHLQPCCAKTGEGVMEGMDFLTSFRGGKGLTMADCDGPGKETGASGYRSSDPEPAAAEPEPARSKTLAAAELADDVFLQAFQDRQLKPFGPTEMMRLALLKRVDGSSALATLETARLQGCVAHATRMHFWAARSFAAPLPEKIHDTRSFLEAHPELLPKLDAEREALIRQAYSEKIDREATWAHMVVPPDLETADDDASFWARTEQDAGAYTGELDSFCSLVRLAFLLLKALPRREAIQRLDQLLRRWEATGRPFHDTRQYVALQLAHLALTQHPSLQEKPFTRLQELCPELCEEDCIYKYYSEKALSQGQSSFQAPDLQPLPSKLDVAVATWHEQLNDQEFLQAVRARSLSSWGLPSLARLSYLYLSELGRPRAVQKLLGDLEDARSVKALNLGLFAHETLAYFTMHMIHYFIASQELSMAQPFSELVKKCAKIVDPTLYRAYYSDQAIHCTEARNSFVVPDLCPLPDLLPQARVRS